MCWYFNTPDKRHIKCVKEQLGVCWCFKTPHKKRIKSAKCAKRAYQPPFAYT